MFVCVKKHKIGIVLTEKKTIRDQRREKKIRPRKCWGVRQRWIERESEYERYREREKK